MERWRRTQRSVMRRFFAEGDILLSRKYGSAEIDAAIFLISNGGIGLSCVLPLLHSNPQLVSNPLYVRSFTVDHYWSEVLILGIYLLLQLIWVRRWVRTKVLKQVLLTVLFGVLPPFLVLSPMFGLIGLHMAKENLRRVELLELALWVAANIGLYAYGLWSLSVIGKLMAD